MCKIGTFQGNLPTIFLKVLNIYLFSKIFQKLEIVMLWSNIFQYLTKMLRQYFNCNEILEIFLTFFCNILYYVGLASLPGPSCFKSQLEPKAFLRHFSFFYLFSKRAVRLFEDIFQFITLFRKEPWCLLKIFFRTTLWKIRVSMSV